MLMKDKIKEILQTMIDKDEFNKAAKCSKDGLTPYSEEKEIKRYAKSLGHAIDEAGDIYKLPILPLIFEMPQSIATNVLVYLLNYKVFTLTDEEKKGRK